MCAIQWGLNGTSKELVSSHGFSDNQLILWKYSHSTLTKSGVPRTHIQSAAAPLAGQLSAALLLTRLFVWEMWPFARVVAATEAQVQGKRRSRRAVLPRMGQA